MLKKNKLYRKSQHTFYVQLFPENLSVYEIMLKNVAEPEVADNMAHACCIMYK